MWSDFLRMKKGLFQESVHEANFVVDVEPSALGEDSLKVFEVMNDMRYSLFDVYWELSSNLPKKIIFRASEYHIWKQK